MTVLAKPIPALYTVYILRSTVRHASLYIGSTPNPPRRLKQHNGVAKGGASRTSRQSLRPWEMAAIVSGFPSMTSALKFEWALNNSHISLHIPTESRISVSTQRKKNGQPRRPTHGIQSLLANLHLLLRVPTFSRWPLTLHFFAADVHAAWGRWCAQVEEPLRPTLKVVTDFEPNTQTPKEPEEPDADNEDASVPQPWGIHALPLDHTPLKDFVAKGQEVFDFENEGSCVVCKEDQASGKGLYALCPRESCNGVGHITCWSQHLLSGELVASDQVLPVQGRCPKCQGRVQWVDMMKEMSLRTRGPTEVQRLLKKRKKAKV